jgi:poly-gamma-glutamate capsule biosynthesis protein CapA/YwtB (metallophosphatase superfamily)
MKKKAIAIMLFFCMISIAVFFILISTFNSYAQKGRIEKLPHYVKDQHIKSNEIDKNTKDLDDFSQKDSILVKKPANASDKQLSSKNGLPSDHDISATENASETPSNDPIILGFAGDVNLDENSKPSAHYDKCHKDITACISKDLLTEMKNADIMMLNNEFSYSIRGIKTPNKSYTFRANPDRAEILNQMNVDIVSLANNHTLDYGQDALMDTFDTLDNAGIDYVGAGKNLDRAKAPIYYTIDDKKIAFLAASKVIFSTDWYATDNRPGMIGTYSTALLIQCIKKVKAKSDYVIVYVHWGVERNDTPEKYQRNYAKQYIDAGADAVIGAHPHVLQGLEYYNGKPIAYSLGNYWFNSASAKTALLKLYLDADQTIRMQILPSMQKNTYTSMIQKENKRREFFDYMKKISFNVNIDKDGFVTKLQ